MELSSRLWRTLLLGALVVAVAVGLVACGGGDDSTGSSSTSSGEATSETSETSAGVDQAKVDELLDAAFAPGKWEGPKEPAPAPEGKSIVFIPTFAAAEGEVILQEGVETAAKALNWDLTVIDGKGTPQGYSAAIGQAITQKADGVIFGAIDPNLVLNQMKQLKAAGIPVVVQSNVSEPTEELWVANVGYRPQLEAEYLAAFLADESQGEAKVLLVEDSEFGIVAARAEAFKPALEELCSACEINAETEFSVTELETKLGPKIGAALQANPDVNYIYAPYDAAVPPMVAAIKQAGLQDEVKIISYGGFKQVTDYLRNQEITVATVANATQWQGWQAYDALIRHWDDLEINEEVTERDPIKLLTWENPPPPGQYFEGDADYMAEYEKLWGLK
ncbi:MAG: sugar ABC transporter substrate-binding protein [Solirubrobacterales bacterium]